MEHRLGRVERTVVERPAHGGERAAVLGAAACATATGLALYLPTAARGVGFIDRGELAAVACTLGIAHPTGYPTLALLGKLVVSLVPLRPVLALNLFAAVLAAAGLGVLTLLYDHILARLAPAAGVPRPAVRAACALLAALATGVTTTWWQQANGFEAYALHALLLPLVLLTFVRWADALRGGAAGVPHMRKGMVFAFTLGLALTNHLTTVLLAPACIVAMLAVSGLRAVTARRLLVIAPAFALGLTPYLYLPLRSLQHPRFDWGNVEIPWRLVEHLSARQYRVWMFSSFEAARQQLGFFFARLPEEFVWAGLAVVGWGALLIWRADRMRAMWLALIVIASLVYFGGYAIRDIDPYAMPAYVVFGVCFAAGLMALAERFGARSAVVVGTVLVVASAFAHVRECDERENHLVEDLTRNVLQSLPENAVLVSSQWDYTVSASLYLQTVERLRPDVLVVNPELMRRSWYLQELARRAPAFAARFEPEAAVFARAVLPFERGRPFESVEIQAAYESMLEVMVARWLNERRVFVSSEVAVRPWNRYARVPAGLNFELRADSGYVAMPFPRWQWRPWRQRTDPYVATVSWIYGEGLVARAAYEDARGRPELARRYGAYALEFDPGFRRDRIPALPYDGRELVLQTIGFFERVRAGQGTAR